jgi:hypothetical protein
MDHAEKIVDFYNHMVIGRGYSKKEIAIGIENENIASQTMLAGFEAKGLLLYENEEGKIYKFSPANQERLAIVSAFKKLDIQEQKKIRKLFKPFEKYYCMSRLSENSKIELIGKIGIWTVLHNE